MSKDGDFILYESRAISRYIALKYPSQGTPLVPPLTNSTKWAIFEEAASVEQNNFDPFASGIASELVFKPYVSCKGMSSAANTDVTLDRMRGGQSDRSRVEDLTATLRLKLEGYERILSKREYLAGDVRRSFTEDGHLLKYCLARSGNHSCGPISSAIRHCDHGGKPCVVQYLYKST